MTINMSPTFQRILGFEYGHRFSARLLRRAMRRVGKCVGVDVSRLRWDWHDNSIEVYDCAATDRLTAAQTARLWGMGLAICWLNSHDQEVAYAWHRKEGVVRPTGRDSRRRPLPVAEVR